MTRTKFAKEPLVQVFGEHRADFNQYTFTALCLESPYVMVQYLDRSDMMRICLACEYEVQSYDWICSHCNYIPEKLNNYFSFASEIALDSASYPIEGFDRLANIERTYFWFRARLELIQWAIEKYFVGAKTYFEVGCGTGFSLFSIQNRYPRFNCVGSEVSLSGLNHASKLVNGAELIQMDARKIPFRSEFDLIGAFDVIEHIAEDTVVLQQMHAALRVGGGLILTVPQHSWLWSKADEHACHVRRYSRSELVCKVQEAGFKVLKTTSFVSLLLPVMLLSRLCFKTNHTPYDPLTEFAISNRLNNLFYRILRLERSIVSSGLSLPLGGSLLVVAKKQ